MQTTLKDKVTVARTITDADMAERMGESMEWMEEELRDYRKVCYACDSCGTMQTRLGCRVIKDEEDPIVEANADLFDTLLAQCAIAYPSTSMV